MSNLGYDGAVPTDHLERLAQLQAQIEETRARESALLEERNQAIRDAHDAGVTWVAIGEVFGFSHQAAMKAARAARKK